VAGRFVVMVEHRDETVEIVGGFATRGKAFSYMDKLTTLNPHLFKKAKVRPIVKPDPKIEKGLVY
jgi:hypothetical protein